MHRFVLKCCRLVFGKNARKECKVPWSVYRPAMVVGGSMTGAMDKVDGPYYFFKLIQRMRQLLAP